MQLNNIKFGADPELFLINPKDATFVSAHDLIPGTKENPYPVPDGAVQVDGTAAEFNINPVQTPEQFISNIKSVISSLGAMVPQFTLVSEPVADYTEAYFKGLPEKAVELGCNPDYNAYTGGVNPMPDARVNFRTGSGHVHIGWTEDADPFNPEHFGRCRALVVQLDYALGLNSLLWDTDNRRRELYGKAGAFRPKPYGVEYRVLSNKWVLDDVLCRFVYEASSKAIDDFNKGIYYDDQYPGLAETCINSNTYAKVEGVPTYSNDK